MPLPVPAPRKLLHLRDIAVRGYLREDGQIDVEAHMTDVKTHTFGNTQRGEIPAGDPLHGMWLRLTIDDSLTITAVAAAMDYTPHHICPAIIPNFQRLVGLSIAKGFLRAASERLGGTDGCTHLRELLHPIGTVTFQTVFSVKGSEIPRDSTSPGSTRIPAILLNTCHAYKEPSPLQAAAE